MKKYFMCFFLFCIFSRNIYAQFSLGVETGGDAPITEDKYFSPSFFISPKLEIPYFTFMYGFHARPARNTDLHTIDVGVRFDVGDSIVKPYFLFGTGYAVLSANNNFLHGNHLFGTFGINIILEKFIKKVKIPLTVGVFARYNALLYDQENYFNPNTGFSTYQFLTYALNLGFIF